MLQVKYKWVQKIYRKIMLDWLSEETLIRFPETNGPLVEFPIGSVCYFLTREERVWK